MRRSLAQSMGPAVHPRSRPWTDHSATGPERLAAPPVPGYAALHRTGELLRRAEQLREMLADCRLCPRECRVNRLAGARGFCGAGAELEIASWHPHFGEEPPLVGRSGSGTIFLSHCGLRCAFCQNWEISHGGEGGECSAEEMAAMMIDLQARGCHNINVVTPTHYSPHVLLALDIAAGRGLQLPLVYNTSGWERLEILRLLDGVVDIYLPDLKYADGRMAARFSAGARTYPEVARHALCEMHRQVGVARVEADGLVRRGLMVRHLVMPNDVAGSCATVRWLAESLPRDTYINLMSQYRPCYRAFEYPEIARPIRREEYERVVACARAAGLTNVEIQGSPL